MTKLPRDITFNLLHDANFRRCEQAFHPLNAWTVTDWATALAGETGEYCNIVKKLRRLESYTKKIPGQLPASKLIQLARAELADIVIYADLNAARLGIDLGEAVRDKFNAVSDKVGSHIKL